MNFHQSFTKREAERRIAAKAERYNAEAKKIKAVTDAEIIEHGLQRKYRLHPLLRELQILKSEFIREINQLDVFLSKERKKFYDDMEFEFHWQLCKQSDEIWRRLEEIKRSTSKPIPKKRKARKRVKGIIRHKKKNRGFLAKIGSTI